MLLHLALWFSWALGSAAGQAPAGIALEARSASVFAGACHYGAEYTTQGREALCAWRFESGSFDGVSLAGVSLACVLVADRNQDEPEARVASVALLDAAASPEARAASLAWLRATLGPRLGTLRAARVVPLAVAAEGERYALAAGPEIRLEGALLPDRACCTMPVQRWYAPLTAVRGEGAALPPVGCSEAFALAEPALGVRFRRSGENDAFVGRFGPASGGVVPAGGP